MAGDWIKMRMGLRTHPKVVRISSALRADRLRVIGALHAVWCLADEHTEDGNLPGYTVDALDESIGWPGFSTAMKDVGWIVERAEGLVLPRFDEHNGASAKRRAQEAERKRRDRKESAGDADEKRTRVEKEKEKEKEVKSTTDITVVPTQQDQQQKHNGEPATRRRTKLELTELPESWRVWCLEHHGQVDPAVQFGRFRDHHLSKGSVMADWQAAWRTWCSRVVDFGPRGTAPVSKQAALEARNEATARAWSPPVDDAGTPP